jgi:hypothetical protein
MLVVDEDIVRRWAQYEVTKIGTFVFFAIPRDRTPLFNLMVFVKNEDSTDVRFWQSLALSKRCKWFNGEGNNLDRSLLNKFDVSVWEEKLNVAERGLLVLIFYGLDLQWLIKNNLKGVLKTL